MEFVDRRDAGRRLVARLPPFPQTPVVVALPRGGVPVAYEIARALHAPLDILAVRKLGAPGNPEFGIGAIAEDGTSVLDQRTARAVGVDQRVLDETVAREARELHRRVVEYRDGREPLDLHGRTVVVVDDGLATGLTDLAAVRAVRARGAARIVVAVPVGSPEAVALLRREADDVVCHTTPAEFLGVGRWYEDFSAVSDAEVVSLLEAARRADPDAQAGEAPSEAGEQPARLPVTFPVAGSSVAGDLTLPPDARGLVLFAHGSGSSRLSPRNRAVAQALNRAGFATLLLDLLTEEEAGRRDLVFDIPRLAQRLELATRWALEDPRTHGLAIGYFGASTGAGAALHAAADLGGDAVRAVVSRGGRPDLAADRLPHVTAPTLLIVGGEDPVVLDLNRRAGALLRCEHRIAIVPGAGHLFEEPGTLEAVTDLATRWFAEQLDPAARPRAAAKED